MTRPSPLKITLDEKRCKFLFHVQHEDLQHWDDPPVHLIETAVRSMIEDRFPSRLHHHQFFGERVKAVWNALPRFPEQKNVQIIVAQFHPELPGFVVDMDSGQTDQVFVTLPANPELLRSWHPAWLEAAANLKIARTGGRGHVNPAQLRMIYSRAAHFRESIVHYPLSTAARAHPTKSGKAFHILVHPQRLEIEVILGDLRYLMTEDAQRLLFDDMDHALWKFIHVPGRTPFLKDFRKLIRKSVEAALQQPQGLGLELPLILPGAYFLRDEEEGPRLTELKTIAAHFQMRNHAQTENQVSYFPSVDMQEHQDLLKARGIPGAATFYPVSSLSLLDQDVVSDFLSFAKYGRAHCLSSQRELQAMIFAIPGSLAERYSKDLESFWQDFIKTFGTNQAHGQPITVISHFFPMSVNPHERKPLEKGRKRQDHDQASWLPMLVREIISLPSIPADSAVIAASLAPNVSESAVKKALDSLLSLGMITYDPTHRRYQQRERNVVTGDEKASERILRIHDEMSELAAAVLENPPESMRSIAINLLIDPASFEAAKHKIREWLHSILDSSSKERDQDHLYQISIQMFQGPY